MTMVESKDSNPAPAEDRRESPRVPMRFLLRRLGTEESFESREGNLSLGGFAWHGSALEVGTQVEVRFLLPGSTDEIRAQGEVLHQGDGPRGPSSHARFIELPLEAEMTIARYLDKVGGVE